ncbi:hypothetical protein FBU59_005328 [Linderina macrospora]|uniref:Uncharacterized protein n=1 Tax=Linderina macrospora TaxID=4868 RepID=A0ACC1J301_9FUNG|nr:hypothetical protein FBU59_005328 [Linderina macrospora]
MNSFIVTIVALLTSTVSAIPIYGGYYPGVYGGSQSNVHNTGAYDNGATSNVSPFGSNSNSWNSGFAASQGNYANPFGNSGSSNFNQWNNNAYANTNNLAYGAYYPRLW